MISIVFSKQAKYCRSRFLCGR